MRAVLVRELGQPPEPAEVDPPARAPGQALVEIAAAPINPLDVAIAAGRFYAGSPPLPYIPGCEGVGRVVDADSLAAGERVYIFGDGLGLKRDGTMAERALIAEDAALPVSDGAEDAVAAACGIAGLAGWLPLARRAPVREDDVVLVLGATGTAGLVALQAARVLGARRVVAAGRNRARLERARELGADAVVELEGEDVARAIAEAAGGAGPTWIYDPLWGPPIVAALEAAAPGARVVQLGSSAAPEATVPSAAIRGKQLEIYGHTNFAVPRDVLRENYRTLVEHVAAGRIRIDVETLPLERVREAWQRQAEGPHVKLVLTPD